MFFLPSVAMAGQCPMLVAQVTEQLATTNLSAEYKAESDMLCDQAVLLHKCGVHAASEQRLAEALVL